MSRTQACREMSFTCPLGPDVLLFHAMSGEEALGRPFTLEVELLSERPSIDPDQLLGYPASVAMRLPDGVRYFHGLIARFRSVRTPGPTYVYRATLAPWLWMLSRTTDCRIFQDQTVPEILKEVFNSLGFSDFRLRLTGEYARREYCVQYRETALDFVSRLMEEEGISYHFEHHADKHIMVLHDSQIAHVAGQGCAGLRIREGSHHPGHEEAIWNWCEERQVLPGSTAFEAYDFMNPRRDLRVASYLDREHAHAEYEIFDYSTRYFRCDRGEHLARVRLEAVQAAHRVVSATTDVRGLRPGATFTLRPGPGRAADEALLVTRARYRLRSDAYHSTPDAPTERPYECEFEALPLGVQFRTPQVTPRPEIRGPQTAVVVGPAGQEIFVDEHARVKVQFHWDRYGRADEHSSCWIRVSQPWAGKGYGGLAIPRIGQEVIVEFLEGDPDRPIITGRVYNGASMPPVSNAGRDKSAGPAPSSVVEAAMMTSIRSQSLGGSGGCNEITMNDAAGAEGLFIKAQKDEIHVVGNDRKDTVGNNETLSVAVDRTRSVGNNESVTVGVNQHIKVGSSIKIEAGSSIVIECGLSRISMNAAGVISISGSMINIAGMANVNMAAPLTNVAGAIMLNLAGAIANLQGMTTKVGGSALLGLSGEKITSEAGGEHIIRGTPIKLNG